MTKTLIISNDASKAQLEESGSNYSSHTLTMAEVHTIPSVRASLTINRISKNSLDVSALYSQLADESHQVIKENDTQPLEAMLLGQAQVLNTIFHNASDCITKRTLSDHIKGYVDIAVKANNACRKTILALQQLKNPAPTTFIKQQNNALNQQINQPEILDKEKI